MGLEWIAAMALAASVQGTPAASPMADMPGMTHATAACPAQAAPVPPELSGWMRGGTVKAGRTAQAAPVLSVGSGVTLALSPTPAVRYPLRPEKPGGSVSSGGLAAFAVRAVGRYRVALGSAAWIDVVRDGKPQTSVAHGHGPACSDIRKMVDFDLTPGRYLVQVVGNGSVTLPLLVARLP